MSPVHSRLASVTVNSASILKAQPSQAPDLSRLHRNALPETRMSSLSENSLTRVYTKLIVSNCCQIFTYSHNLSLVGCITLHSVDAVLGPKVFLAAPFGVCLAAMRHPRIWQRDTFEHLQISKSVSTGKFISAIFVDESTRGQGLGSALLEVAVERAAGQPLLVDTRVENTGARAMYERAGFLPIRMTNRSVLYSFGP